MVDAYFAWVASTRMPCPLGHCYFSLQIIKYLRDDGEHLVYLKLIVVVNFALSVAGRQSDQPARRLKLLVCAWMRRSAIVSIMSR